MNVSHKLKKIIFSTWFLAGIPALLIILFVPALGSRYTLSVEQGEKYSGTYIYEDLNSDSISELIYLGKGAPYYYIAVKNHDGHIYDQWNLADSVDPKISDIFFGNYNHDRFKEIYVFTHNRDSLFLNVNEMLDPTGIKRDRIFITKIGYTKGEVTSVLYPVGFFDENGDGFDEIYFSISTGYAQEPRKLYFYDLVHKSLRSSEFTGTICLLPNMKDADGDMRPEIFGTMSASGNYKANVPYSDSSTWFMVFNDQLKFSFPTVEFRGFANALYINTFSNGNFKGYALSHFPGGTDTTVLKSQIMIYSLQGKLIRSRLTTDLGYSGYSPLFITSHNNSDRIYLFHDKILELNDKLEILREIKSPFKRGYITYKTDLNNDNEEEFLLYSENGERLAVYSAGLHKLTEIKFKTSSPDWKFSHYISKDHESKLFLRSGDMGYFLKLNRNNFYFLGYLAYPVIYFLCFFFISIIIKINTFQVEKKERLNQRLVTLQLQGIKAQLDPHFTFNTLNSVASLIYLDDRHAAYDYMIKFTRLLRGMLNDAERIYRSLNDELNFLTTYLELEKLRFGDRLKYEIEVDKGVNQSEQVPKLVLQTFAENAIKHGILPSTEGGLLKISVRNENDYLKLTIEDNGIGRKAAEGHSTSTGRGLKITGEFYDILNQINKKPIRHTITDLYNTKGEPAGTKVDVWVPAGYK